MVVVSDTSVIIGLSEIGKLDLLKILFEKVLIPQKVYLEIITKCKSEKTIHEVKSAEWIVVASTSNLSLVSLLLKKLDAGESEAIALALELNADYLLIDEYAGRVEAKKLGVRTLGAIGVLIEAKDNHLISSVTELMMLMMKNDFKINPLFYEKLKRDLNE